MTTVRFVWWTTTINFSDSRHQPPCVSISPFARLIRLQRPPLPLHARQKRGWERETERETRSSAASGVNVGGGVGLNDREFQAVADAGAELVEEAAAAQSPRGSEDDESATAGALGFAAELGKRGIRGFVRVFVPHDLDKDDTDYFAKELEEDPRWRQLVEKCRSSRTAKVTKIIGDQVSAEFRYFMPNQAQHSQGGGVRLSERRLEGGGMRPSVVVQPRELFRAPTHSRAPSAR